MRVVFDARYLNGSSSGVGVYCSNLLRAMLAVDPTLEVVLVTREPGLAKRFDERRCQELCFAAAPRSLSTLYALARCLRSVSADLFHGPFNLMPSGVPMPAVVTVHDVMQLQNPANISTSAWVQNTAGRFWRSRLRHAASHAAHIVAVSSATKDGLLERFPELPFERVTVTPNGVDPFYFEAPSAADLQEARRRVGDHPFVLCVGNESPHKNHERAVQAFLDGFAPESPMRFVLVRRSVRHDPRMVRLLGSPQARARVVVLEHTELPILRALYHEARIFFFPSWVEGFGIPILEAMACGTPVVTSDRSAPSEVARQAAELVNPFDISAMGRALARIHTDESRRLELVEAGRKRAAEFTWERCARATLEAYARTLNGGDAS